MPPSRNPFKSVTRRSAARLLLNEVSKSPILDDSFVKVDDSISTSLSVTSEVTRLAEPATALHHGGASGLLLNTVPPRRFNISRASVLCTPRLSQKKRHDYVTDIQERPQHTEDTSLNQPSASHTTLATKGVPQYSLQWSSPESASNRHRNSAPEKLTAKPSLSGGLRRRIVLRRTQRSELNGGTLAEGTRQDLDTSISSLPTLPVGVPVAALAANNSTQENVKPMDLPPLVKAHTNAVSGSPARRRSTSKLRSQIAKCLTLRVSLYRQSATSQGFEGSSKDAHQTTQDHVSSPPSKRCTVHGTTFSEEGTSLSALSPETQRSPFTPQVIHMSQWENERSSAQTPIVERTELPVDSVEDMALNPESGTFYDCKEGSPGATSVDGKSDKELVSYSHTLYGASPSSSSSSAASPTSSSSTSSVVSMARHIFRKSGTALFSGSTFSSSPGSSLTPRVARSVNIKQSYIPASSITGGQTNGQAPGSACVGGLPSGTLENPERRRLSLSQSDPVPVPPNALTRPNLETLQCPGLYIQKNTVVLTHDSEHETSPEHWVREHTALANDSASPTGSAPPTEQRSVTPSGFRDGGSTCNSQSAPLTPTAFSQRSCRRLSVSGLPSASRQNNFENKRRQIRSDTGYFDAGKLISLGIGYTCKKGLKPESPNQDDFFIIRMDDWSLYGVFDGHGPYGHDVSNFVQRELPRLICNDALFNTNPKKVLHTSFIKVHAMLQKEGAKPHARVNCSLSGTTASVILHRRHEHKLYVAHVGDSRCVLGRRHSDGRIEAVDLTRDHKPNDERERKRIVQAGGQVRKMEGDIPYRVFLKGQLYPGLAMSRALGDVLGTQAGISCEPDITEYSINKNHDLFITLCSDGVWEFLDSQAVVEIIHSGGRKDVQGSADALAKESWARWIESEGNVVDDITAEIIYLDDGV